MKIVTLKAENVKRLVAVEIAPDGNMVQITGRNGQGKTSVLDSIFWALAGTKSHQPEPIRRGQKEARIKLDMGELIVRREFRMTKPRKEGAPEQLTTKVVVENTEKAVFRSPQGMLDSLLGSLSFDPLAFARMEPREQYEEIKRLAGLDFDQFETRRKTAYDKRTDINRVAKSKRMAMDQIKVPDNAPEKPVDVSELVALLTEARETNEKTLRLREERTRLQHAVEDAERDKAQARKMLEVAEERLVAVTAAVAKAVEPPEMVSVAEIEQKIANADKENKAHQSRAERDRLRRDAEENEAEAEKLTAEIDNIKAEAKAAIEAAKMPIDGLSLESGIVTFNGLPLEQASDAEQLRVSCAIAMSRDNKLRVIRIRHGNDLDSASLAMLAEMAEAEDYQVWIERVDETGKVGFVIEDGQLQGGGDGADETSGTNADEGGGDTGQQTLV